MDTTRFSLDGIEMLKKTVKPRGTAGGIYVPYWWIGRRVAIILLNEEPVQEDEPEGIPFFEVEVDD